MRKSRADSWCSCGALLFALQLLLAAALVLTASFASRCIGCWIAALLGAALMVWAWLAIGPRRLHVLPEVCADAELVTALPYRVIRHPMYSGLLLFTAGLGATDFALWKLIAWLALCLTLDAKSRIEERLLIERFPQYEAYRQRSRRFVPFLY